METLANYINGEFVAPKSGLFIDNINPATNELISKVPRSSKEDVDLAVNAAKSALTGEWAHFSTTQRADILDKIADKLEERASSMAPMESRDSGKTITMATNVDIPRAVANFRFFAGAVRHDTSECFHMADAINYTKRNPVGVFGLITPWNLPIYLLSWKIAPCLAMGNTIVAKVSEMTPMTASALAEIIDQVGLPKGVFNLVHGLGPEAGQALIEHPKIRGISFTGGTKTGEIVARTAAPMFKKLSLELGGKNSTIVFEDCEYEKTIAGAVRSAFLNQGQVCLAGSRLFVQRSIYARFLTDFVAKVKELKVGDPSDKDTFLGALISQQHLQKVESYVTIALEEGGVVECGGSRPKNLPVHIKSGAFFMPTVISGLSATARASVEEIFGPVVTIHPFDTEEEVVAFANATDYGLAGSVWTSNLKRAHRVCDNIETGMLWVNCWLHRDLRVPFGGVKNSGIGREGGKHSLEFFSEQKNVCIHMG